MFTPPSEASQKHKAYQPVSLENLGWVTYNPFRNQDNLLLLDIETAISEAMLFKRAGGGTIVDATTIGIGRDPKALAAIARATGINVVMGAGYYVDAVHPAELSEKTEAEIAGEIVADITTGVDGTGVRAGIIGEIGCTWPLTDSERKVLMGAARAQRETGAAILVHPGRNEAAPFEILDVLGEAGASIDRVVMSHIDRTIQDTDMVLELARRGCYLEYDLFGWETSYYPLSSVDMLSDAQRIDYVKRLVDEGFGARVVLAQDIFAKHKLTKYGGHGYGHILENIVPRLHEKGLSEEQVNVIVVENPANILTFVEART